jgi:putative peptide zinc metalloprotease protein
METDRGRCEPAVRPPGPGFRTRPWSHSAWRTIHPATRTDLVTAPPSGPAPPPPGPVTAEHRTARPPSPSPPTGIRQSTGASGPSPAARPGRGQHPGGLTRRPPGAPRAGRLRRGTSRPAGADRHRGRLTPERYLRGQAARPGTAGGASSTGSTGGRVNFGPSPAERAERQLIARAKSPVAGCRSIAVISRRGGVGQDHHHPHARHTLRLAARRPGGRPGRATPTPARRLPVRRETARHRHQPARRRAGIIRYADIRSYTNQAPTRLGRWSPPTTTRGSPYRPGEEDYRRAIRLLERHYNLILLDTGTGVLESATKGILQLADQIVVVMSPSLDSARAASLDAGLAERERPRRAGPQRHRGRQRGGGGGLVEVTSRGALSGALPGAWSRVPWDPHLSAGAETQVDRLRPVTRRRTWR